MTKLLNDVPEAIEIMAAECTAITDWSKKTAKEFDVDYLSIMGAIAYSLNEYVKAFRMLNSLKEMMGDEPSGTKVS